MRRLGARSEYAGEFIIRCRSRRGGERWTAVVVNGVTTAVCDELNRLLFGGGSAVARTWAIGIMDAAGFTGVSRGDTVSAHPGWAEFTGYTPVQPTWPQTASVNGQIDSLSTLSVTVTTAASLKGLFLVSADLLHATGETRIPLPVLPGDVLSLRYKVTAKARPGT